ncbi:GNAT family N-acetyltransferase [Gracilibacillus halophilus]|nr:GNAT family N-acetyltransferase [Gracilibacillus halophilus]
MNRNDIKISQDKSLLDMEAIYEFLQQSYWANRRTKEKMIKSIEYSFCYGVYHHNKQIGFARIVTDYATMYYLCDVFIDEQYRGNGIGKRLIEEITRSDDFKDLFGYLSTRDAHLLYEQYDFHLEQEKVMTRIPDFLRKK